MKKLSYVFLLFMLPFAQLQAQSYKPQSSAHNHVHAGEHTQFMCNYYGESFNSNVYVSKSSAEAQAAIAGIIDAIGLKPKFEIRSSNIPNAAATIVNNKRYILYNEKFMSSIVRAAQNDWAAISILAHEIGHHLNGHTLEAGGSRPYHELEADEFSGFVLQRMGASLTEAQTAIGMIASPQGNSTHPGRSHRLKSIEKGWLKGEQQGVVARQERKTIQQPGYEEQLASQQPRQAEARARASAQPAAQINANQVLSRVHITGSDDTYYITKGYNFVKETSNGLKVLGKVRKSDSRQYPLLIVGNQNEYLMISEKGALVDRKGNPVGYLKS
jgi:hypothetical protein